MFCGQAVPDDPDDFGALTAEQQKEFFQDSTLKVSFDVDVVSAMVWQIRCCIFISTRTRARTRRHCVLVSVHTAWPDLIGFAPTSVWCLVMVYLSPLP